MHKIKVFRNKYCIHKVNFLRNVTDATRLPISGSAQGDKLYSAMSDYPLWDRITGFMTLMVVQSSLGLLIVLT